jgi:hypothetical protein
MLARIGPVKPFLPKSLIAHSKACGAPKDEQPSAAAALVQRRRRRFGGKPGRAKGTHMSVSAVSAESVGGTLSENRFSWRSLCHNEPVQHARVSRETAWAAARRTGRPAG